MWEVNEKTTEGVDQIVAGLRNSELTRKRTWRIDGDLMIGERNACLGNVPPDGTTRRQVESKAESKTQCRARGQ